MGLDISIYKIKRPNLDISEKITSDWLRENGYSFETKEILDSDSLYAEIIPFAQVVPMAIDVISLKSIARNHGINKYHHAYEEDYDGECETYRFCMDENEEDFQDIVIPNTEISKYMHRTNELFYVYESHEVAYWRKDYDLEETVAEMFPGIRNTEYKKLTKEQYLFIKKNFGSGFMEKRYDPRYTYFYWEWY